MANLWDRYRECTAKGLPGIPRDELLGYLEEAAAALDRLQFQRLQHLDIKPANLLLEKGRVRIANEDLVTDLIGMVGTVSTGATPAYAAPETFEGRITPYTDQYSLAITYMELLTGARPFKAGSIQEIVTQRRTGQPDLSPLPDLDQRALARALATDPERRFPTCADLVRALRTPGKG
ncbi:MAG: protein kinase [Gemmataceae bacterium]